QLKRPTIERVEDHILIRRAKPGRPLTVPVGLPYALLADQRLSGTGYRNVERCRSEFEGWRIYYLDPRVAMREARPPAEVQDIGVLGEDIAPYLYRLGAEEPQRFAAVKRT